MRLIRYVFVLLLSQSAYSLFAQNGIDSFYKLWQDDKLGDSIRVNAYRSFIWQGFLYSNPDSANALAGELIDYGKANKYPIASALGYNTKGVSWALRGDFVKALSYYNKSLEIYKDINDKKGIAKSLNNIANVYLDQGENTKALEYYNQSFITNRELDYKKGMATALNNIGNLYIDQQEPEDALNYFSQSLEINREIKYKKGIAATLGNIGHTYGKKGDYEKALSFFSEGLEVCQEIGDQWGIASALNNIGILYFEKKDYAIALSYQQRSLQIRKKIGDKRGIVRSYLSIGNLHRLRGFSEKAVSFCNQAYLLSSSLGLKKSQRDACNCLFKGYKVLGNQTEALVNLEKINRIDSQLNASNTLKRLQQMEFEKAVLIDSIANEEKSRQMEMAHKLELNKEEKKRNASIAIGVFILLVAAGLYSRLNYVRKSKKALQTEKDRSENLLLNILPAEIAQELKTNGKAKAQKFDNVSILFTDFSEFTKVSASVSPSELVDEIGSCFEAFDHIIDKYDIEKIKTIGDAYMAAIGLPVPRADATKNIVLAALEMQDFITHRKTQRDAEGKFAFGMRVGIHTGSVVAGIVGVKKFQYDVWGDTVNTASRIESSGEVSQVNISESTYHKIKSEQEFEFIDRGMVESKGKGAIRMFFVKRR